MKESLKELARTLLYGLAFTAFVVFSVWLMESL